MDGPVKRINTLAQTFTMAKYNFLNYFRARRFYVMVGIVVLICGLLTFVIAYRRPEAIVGSKSTILSFLSTYWGSFASLVVILSSAFFGGDAISGEFQNRTGYFLVPNPIRRSAIYAGKYLAALAASTIVLLMYAAISLVNGLYFFPVAVPGAFFESVLFAWIYLVAALSLAFAFSSLFKSSAISVLMSVILLLFVFNVVDTVSATFAGIEPWFSITYGSGIIGNILAATYPPRSMTLPPFGGGGFSVTIYNSPVWEGLSILGVYFFAMAALGLWLFEKKEFTS